MSSVNSKHIFNFIFSMIMSMYVCMHVYVHVCAYGFLYWVNDFITAWSKFKYWSGSYTFLF